MNGIWLSYVLAVCFPIFWIAIFLGDFMATKLYRQLCPGTLPSAFNLMRNPKIKKCLLALDEKDLTLSDAKRIAILRLIYKIADVSLAIITIIAILVFVKQGFKFV